MKPHTTYSKTRTRLRLPTHTSGQSLEPWRSGFTLIELLVALVLFGILAGSMAGVLRNTTQSVEQGRDELDNMARMRSLSLLLGSALREADATEISDHEQQMLSYMDDEFDPTYDLYRFRGEESALGFCSPRPFSSNERDGYMHWITLETRSDEENGNVSLWLSDVSFLQEVDNPTEQGWEGTDISSDYSLPKQEICLIKEAIYIAFRFTEIDEDSLTGDEEAEEMDEDDIDGNYAASLPSYIEMDIRLPKLKTETLTFEWNAKANVL